ncbi:hypothetical protein H6F43_03130 [Leptolyngbya sp. FACHB-36]|uniref:hypothetical protein n=1 Tax=Leptolyngbya sp. FACHB-36 TaxID=2692808 RepID=UPI001681BCEF|nr:hypothetical protein [Leptolyngbya sp. FACHB-36]MBD2019177.1 hypothetical protein [Leptolyngbya sp. FACHB-36]
MARLHFAIAGPVSATSDATVPEIKVKKNLLSRRPVVGGEVEIRVKQRGRVRSRKSELIDLKGGIAGKLHYRVRLVPAGPVTATIEVKVPYFLDARPVAAPIGKLGLATVQNFLDPNASLQSLSGQRLVRGDLIPLLFRVQGQKLTGLKGQLTVKRVGSPPLPALTITKSAPATITQADPTIDPQTKLETLSGQFAIEPGDTTGFPDTEVELRYQFSLSDGLGRSYTIEQGTFTVYPAL